MTELLFTRALIERPDLGAEPFITLEEAKFQCRVVDDDEDELIRGLIQAVFDYLDPSSGTGILARALRPQTWELRCDGFPCLTTLNPYGAIELPYPPFRDIVAFAYDDADDEAQSLAIDTDFVVKGVGGEGKVLLLPALDASWPSVSGRPECVRVRYRCGHGLTDESPTIDTLPKSIKQAALMIIAHWYEHREQVVIGQTAVEIPLAAQALLHTNRVY